MKHRALKFIVLGLLVLLALPSRANVTTAVGSASSRQVPLGRTTTVSIVWKVSGAYGGNAQPPFRIASSQGQFVGGLQGVPVLGSFSRTLSRSSPIANYSGLTMRETVTIPASVTYRAYKQGITTIYIERTFDDFDGGIQNPGFVALKISGSGVAGLSLGRQTLYFDDGSARRVVDQDAPLHALTRLDYAGSGPLKGVWEVADPTSTSGQPIYRIIKPVRRFVAAGGEVSLRSPRLKTSVPGRYLVRFRIEEPVAFDELSIEYFVGRKPISEPPVDIALQTPADGGVLREDHPFRWQAQPRAIAYRVELYEKGLTAPPDTAAEQLLGEAGDKHSSDLRGAPVAGALVPATDTSLAPSRLMKTHLHAGHSYQWRVLAIGKDGRAISQSVVREIRVP